MSHCRRYEELIEDLLAGALSPADRGDLAEHCAGCRTCSGLLELHQNLLAVADEIPLPERHELRNMREAVLAATTAHRPAAAPASTSRPGFLADLRNLWHAHPIQTGLAAAAILTCAVFLGRETMPSDPAGEGRLLRSVRSQAVQGRDLDSYLDSPYSFANVSVRPRGEGQLALSFDVSQHMDMQVAQDSPLAREVLLHAIMDPSSMGSRLRAMEVTPQIRDGQLKSALIATMLNDGDATVRLNALAVLARYPYDQQVEAALLQTLGQDQDVQMRLLAIAELAKRDVGLETVQDAVGEDDPNGTMAIVRQAVTTY